MILTGENRSTWRKTCASATLSTINHRRPGAVCARAGFVTDRQSARK